MGFFGFIDDFKGYFENYSDCDVILIQELRVDKENRGRLVPVVGVFEELGYPYHSALWSEKGNGGCITFSKTRLTKVDDSSRSVLVTHTKVEGVHYIIANCYVPNYGYGDGKAKLDFIEGSRSLFGGILDKGAITILAGDFNAVLDCGIQGCKTKSPRPGTFPKEVEWLKDIAKQFSCGEVTAKVTGQNGEFYTYYSFRGRKSGVQSGTLLGSLRLDHVFVLKEGTGETPNVRTVVDNTATFRDHFPLISNIDQLECQD